MRFLTDCLKWNRSRTIALALLAISSAAQAQVQYVPSINTIAGTGTSGYTGDGGPGISAKVANGMRQVASDSQGNVYLTDTTNNVIRRVDARTGVITTVAGNGSACSSPTATCGDGAAATSAQLNNARGIAVDGSGNIYLADYNDHRIRVVTAATGKISTVAGTGSVCSPAGSTCGDGGQAIAATLRNPSAVALDTLGNLYIADEFDYKIRKVILKTGVISTVAGTGTAGFSGDGGAATSAKVNGVTGIACDAAGNLYIADNTNYRVRMVLASNGHISTIAGTGTAGTTGNGGPASSALLGSPYNLAVDASGNVYIADNVAQQIREVIATVKGIDPLFGNIVLFAGGGSSFADGVLPTNTTLSTLNGIAVDPFGDVIIGDTNNARIRRVSFTIPLAETSVGATTSTPTKFIAQTTTSDTLATANFPTGFTEFSVGTLSGCALGGVTPAGTVCGIPFNFTPAYPGLRSAPFQLKDNIGNIFTLGISGYGMGPAIAFTPGTISTIAGNGTAGYAGDGGPATSATLHSPAAATVDSANNIYIADSANHVVRRIDGSTGKITTVAGIGSSGYSGDGGAATGAKLNAPHGVALDPAGNLYIADSNNHAIREVSVQTGNIVTIAGGNGSGYSGDGGPAIEATLSGPAGVTFDVNGYLYVADTGNSVIRQIDTANGTIATIAGTDTGGDTGDGTAALTAEIDTPTSLFLESKGLLLVAAQASNNIRQINLNTGIITTVAGSGTAGYSGDGGLATAAELNIPRTVVADAAGNIYIADTGNAVVRRVDAASGIITTVVGNGTMGYSGDGGAATQAKINYPGGVALDSAANLYIVDGGADVLRKVDVSKGAAIAFGNQGTGTTVTSLLTATNTGTSSLTFTGLNLPTGFAQQTTLGTDCSSTSVLAAGATCNLKVGFTPASATTFTGSLVTTNNALNTSGTTQTTSLSGIGIAAHLAFGIQPSNTTVDAAIAPAVTIRIEDASGATITSATDVVTMSIANNPGSGTLSGARVVNAVNGIATFNGLNINQAGTGYTIWAASTGMVNVTSASFNVGAFVQLSTTLTLSSSLNPSVNGESVTYTATLSPYTSPTFSSNGETITFYNGTSSIGTGTLLNGVATFSTAVLPVGSGTVNQIQARYAGDTNFLAANSATVNQEVDTPNYKWKSVAISGAGALVAGAIVHPQPGGPIYIRTDVGGALRWNAATSRWIPITDGLPFEERQYFSCESLAVDPNDVNVVYYAAGKKLTGVSALLKSTNQGATFTVVSPGLSSVPIAGNADRRWAGERLSVDPSNSSVLLFGSRSTGLWRSTDGGTHWTNVSTIPVASDIYGVQTVIFDPATPGKVYAAVSGSGVYVSTDHGATFASIGGSTSPRRLTVASDGTLWYSAGDGVSKYASSTWTNYTPGPTSPTSGQIYSGLAVNPTDPNDILVGKSEYFYSDTQLYRTKDAGATWTQISYTVSSTAAWFNPTLTSTPAKFRITDLSFDPSNPNVVWSSQYRTDDINGTATGGVPAWVQHEDGHEEDVMNALLTPSSGYELLVGSFDDDGFAMDHGLDSYPTKPLGIVGGANYNTWGMAYEESNPSNMLRVGGKTYYGGAAQNVAKSSDGGATWTRLGAFPNTLFPVSAALSATDANNITIVSSAVYSSDSTGNSWPSSLTASQPWRFSTDGGSTWTASTGLPTPPSYVPQTNFPGALTSDTVTGGTFYYYFNDTTVSPRAGRIYRSTDGGATFTAVNASSLLPGEQWFQLKARPGTAGDLWFSVDQDNLNYQSFATRPLSFEGLYHSADGGATWTKLSNISRAFSFGFGKSASSGGPPTIFVYGRANGATTDSMYRSVDLGSTWINIGSSNFQLGNYPAYIEGSNQNFGRVFIGSQGRGVYYGSVEP